MEWKMVLAVIVGILIVCMTAIATAPLFSWHGPDDGHYPTPVMALVKDEASDPDDLLFHAGPISRYGVGYDEIRIRAYGPVGVGDWNVSMSDFVSGNASHQDILPGYDVYIQDFPQGEERLTVSYGDQYRLSARNGSFAPGDWWVSIVYVWTDGVIGSLSATYG